MDRAEYEAPSLQRPPLARLEEESKPAVGTTEGVHRSLASRAAKRAIDITCAALALVVLLPFALLTAMAIRLTSPGPALFRQTRIGYGGRPFVIYKFRTMVNDNDDTIHRAFMAEQLTGGATRSDDLEAYKLTRDPRVTKLGGYLRRSSVDELPQLINVLLGQMSLVGPRPALPWEVQLFEPKHFVRFDVKPGITGLWQVSGRSQLSMPDALELDAEYARTQRLGLDLAILMKTIPVVLGRRGAW